MKKLMLSILVVTSTMIYGQVPSYYNDVNLTLSGQSLKNELGTKVTNTHTNFLSYTPGVWDALKQTDLEPGNSSKVVLIYGYSDTDGDSTTDRTRGVNNNGGGSTDWNREHAYPRSLGTPNLGSSGPGSDAHHLRPSDVQRNSSRGNRKFADGSGNSKVTSQGYWYPGDEFKGDVARMMMFMYIRYGNRCLPSNVGVGSTVASDTSMIQLFLEWNAEDPVSTLELQRNPILENLQGNRNPFIDNPAFATQIWGGPQAEDRFGNTGGGGDNILCNNTITSFPYSESFEGSFGVWKQATSGDDFNWATRTGSTPSSNTGPSGATLGSSYIYMESSSPNYSNKQAILYSPCYDITNASQATLTFKYHMYGSTAMGNLKLEASLNGTSWTSIWSKSGNQGNSWLTATIDMASYLGKKVQLRFNGTTGTTWQGDIAVDAVSFSTSGSGGGGSSESVRLSITFDDYPEETSWEIRNSSNQIIDSGGTYGSQADGSTINLTGTLAEGCYSLILKDGYGDGICCSYGNGSYTLTNTTTNTVMASGGSFGSQETKNFCIGNTNRKTTVFSKNVVSKAFDFDLFPNPAKDVVTIRLINSIEKISFSITNQVGQIVQKGILVNKNIQIDNLPSGIYFINVADSKNQLTKRFVKL